MSGPARDLDLAEIRRRLTGTGPPEDPLKVDFSGFVQRLPPGAASRLTARLRPASVLIPIVEHASGLRVLLTERATDLRHHAGQVSFPGGRMESGDADLVATALRETHEEIGIEPHRIEVVGCLKPQPTITGYSVTPVVGVLQSGYELRPDPREVDDIFDVPLDYLLDADNERYSEREFEGHLYPVTTIHYGGHRIWGATAGIIRVFREVLIV